MTTYATLKAAIRFNEMLAATIDRHLDNIFGWADMSWDVFERYQNMIDRVEGDIADMEEDLREGRDWAC